MDKPDFVETWICCFAAHVQVKKLKDHKDARGENKITDLFLASAGSEAIKKISVMTYPREMEKLFWGRETL